MRRGFGLVVAILFVLLVSGVGVLGLSLIMSASKNTTDSYLYAQAEIYAKNYTEYAVLMLLKHDFSNGCLRVLENEDEIFKLKADIKYIGDIGECKADIKVAEPRNGGFAVIDVRVNTKHERFKTQRHHISYQKRSIQKI